MSAPVGHTCPDIDKCIDWCKRALRTISQAQRKYDRSSDEYDLLRDIESDIEDIPALLDELRKSNGTLREWGEDLEKDLSKMEEEKYLLEQKLEELQPKDVV